MGPTFAAALRRPDLSVVVVTYNATPFIAECLDSIFSQEGVSVEVIVVDNASADGTVDVVREAYPEVHVIANKENRGFSAANNQGLRHAGGRYHALVNPDTYLFPGCLAPLVAHLDAHPACGVVAPRAYVDKDRTLEICMEKPPTPREALLFMSAWGRVWPRQWWLPPVWAQDWRYMEERDRPIPVAGVAGAYIFTRPEIIARLGGLDEAFYLGYEDTDWCLAVQRLGYRIDVLPNSEMVHYFGQSKRRHLLLTDPVFRWDQGLLTFLRKHHNPAEVALFAAGMGVSNGVGRLRRWLRPPGEAPSAAPGSPHGDVHCTWDGGGHEAFLWELSNTATFIDKFAAFTSRPELTLPGEILARMATGTYFWRAVPANRQVDRPTLASGAVRGG